MSHKIKVVIKRPGEKPYVTNISNTLKNLQSTVEGPIETVTLFSDMVIICNEEGRLHELPHNCNLFGVNFVGTLVFCGTDGEGFTDLPLSFADFKKTFVNLFRKEDAQK